MSFDKPFQADPPRFHPPLVSGCRCAISGVWPEEAEERANPNHDERGQFASAGAGSRPGAESAPLGVERLVAPVSISGQEMGVTDWKDPSARRHALAWARKSLVGKNLSNDETGMTFMVSHAAVRKALAHMPDPRPAQALAKLPELVGNAHYVGTEAPRHDARNVRQIHVFKTEATIAGVPHDVRIVARENSDGSRWLRNWHLTEKKRPA